VIRIGLRPLERMQQTANAIAAGDMSARVETTDERTEVGRLGASLNSMLGQIERAFAEREASEERLRRFLADASHELRTPLTSIRGYAEAFRLGPARDPAELETAMSRIEGESARMGVLVDELLTLARLDEVRVRVRRPVDLPTVAAEACADARAANPGRRIELTAGARGDVIGDEGQLHQVAANLLRNAVQHTPEGTPIDVSVSASGGDVTLAVRDHGGGLPPGAADHAFERFWRHERSRRPGDGGAGLGLAIVAAIAAAHGGSAHAANAPEGGADVWLVLSSPFHEGPPASARS
jgi:two-component system OmpR family sensor kinase